MCHHYEMLPEFESRKAQDAKAQDAKAREAARERQAGLVDRLLGTANKQADERKTEAAPVKEAFPAK